MRKQALKKRFQLFLIFTSITFIISCSMTTDHDYETTIYKGSLNKGDLAELKINSKGTFTFTNETLNETITGKWIDKNDNSLLNDLAKLASGDSNKSISYKLLYEISKNNSSLGEIEIPLIEISKIAAITYIPGTNSNNDLAVLVGNDDINFTEINGTFNYIDIYNPKKTNEDLSYGTYYLGGETNTSGSVNIKSYLLKDNSININYTFTDSLYLNNSFINFHNHPTLNSFIVPSGFLLTDKGNNEGISLGSIQYTPSNIGGLYLLLLSNSINKIIILYINGSSVSYGEYNLTTNEITSLTNFTISNASNGVYTGTISGTTKIRIIFQSNSSFFGAVYKTDGTYYENYIGLKQ